MTSNISKDPSNRLPQPLRSAQEAMGLPEVQEMLRKLAKYNLGIYMPHMHDEKTGEFQPLAEGLTQVEEGGRVSFQPIAELAKEEAEPSHTPVGWIWREGVVPVVSLYCRGNHSGG